MRGNFRLLMFPPFGLPPATPLLSAERAESVSAYSDGYHATFETAFDSKNRMVVGYNPYAGPRFISFYSDPNAVNPQNPFDPAYSKPDGAFKDFYGWPVGMTFDADDNLYAYDANRKLLVYRKPLANVREVTVLSPNGGEGLHADSTTTITWTALPSVRAVNIEWKPYETAPWRMIVQGAPNTGAFLWAVPRVPGDGARIRITNSFNRAHTDISDQPFRVIYTFDWKVSANLVCSNGTTPLQNAGSTRFMHGVAPPDPVTWKYASGSQVLSLHSSNSMNNIYVALETNDGQRQYLTPVAAQVHAAIQAGSFFAPPTPMIRFAALALPEATYPLSFYAPTRWCPGTLPVRFVHPAANEIVTVGTTLAVSWQPKGSPITMKIEFSKDNGKTWILVHAGTPNVDPTTGSFRNRRRHRGGSESRMPRTRRCLR